SASSGSAAPLDPAATRASRLRHSFSAMLGPLGRKSAPGGPRMNESRAVLDAETPVNPYSLLDAVNRSSATMRTAWLLLLALMAYVLVIVAAVGHEDLLLEHGVTLPLLGARIALERFFTVAPMLFVAVHVAVLGQLVVLARKTSAFADAIRMLEIGEEHSHPLRLELDNFFFVQAMAGPER